MCSSSYTSIAWLDDDKVADMCSVASLEAKNNALLQVPAGRGGVRTIRSPIAAVSPVCWERLECPCSEDAPGLPLVF